MQTQHLVAVWSRSASGPVLACHLSCSSPQCLPSQLHGFLTAVLQTTTLKNSVCMSVSTRHIAVQIALGETSLFRASLGQFGAVWDRPSVEYCATMGCKIIINDVFLVCVCGRGVHVWCLCVR